MAPCLTLSPNSGPGVPPAPGLERPQASLEGAARRPGPGSLRPGRAGAGGRLSLPQRPRDAQHVLAAQLAGAGHCAALLLPGGCCSGPPPSPCPGSLVPLALTSPPCSGWPASVPSCCPGLLPGSVPSTNPSTSSSAPPSSCCPWPRACQASTRSSSSACERRGGHGESPCREGGSGRAGVWAGRCLWVPEAASSETEHGAAKGSE